MTHSKQHAGLFLVGATNNCGLPERGLHLALKEHPHASALLVPATDATKVHHSSRKVHRRRWCQQLLGAKQLGVPRVAQTITVISCLSYLYAVADYP